MATPGFVPAGFAVAASLSGDHEVQMGATGGNSVVRLHHARALGDTHLHCCLTRVLVAFTESQSGEPDHILHFASATQFIEERDEESLISKNHSRDGATATQQPIAYCVAATEVRRAMAKPPLRPVDSLIAVRTTVLLI